MGVGMGGVNIGPSAGYGMHGHHPGMLQGMQNGQQQPQQPPPPPHGARFPVFTPQQGANGQVASPAMNGVNGTSTSTSSPYPAYQHASSSAASPSLSNTTVNTATTPATTGPVAASPPMQSMSPATNGIHPIPSYLASGHENPYAHLHQQHGTHPHHNPYVNMQPPSGTGMSSYGNVYQPFTPMHHPPPLSPAAGHLLPQQGATPKVTHRSAYGYPVANVASPSTTTRKPQAITGHDSGISVPHGGVNGKTSLSPTLAKTTPAATTTTADEPSDGEPSAADASDSEPVFASINQAVVEATKTRRKHPHPQGTSDGGVGAGGSVKSDHEEVAREPVEVPVGEGVDEETITVGQARIPDSSSFIDENGDIGSAHAHAAAAAGAWIAAGRPCPRDSCPGVVFHRATAAVPARLYPVIKTWRQVERRAKAGGKSGAAGSGRVQTVPVRFRGKRRGGRDEEAPEPVFGEVTREVVAQVKERRDLERRQEEATIPVPENEPELRPSTPVSEKTAAVEAAPIAEPASPATPVPPPAAQPPSPSPAPAPKPAPKSWAALLRGTAPKPSPSTPAISTPSASSVAPSNMTSPTLAQSALVEQIPGSSENQSPKKVVVVPFEGSVPASVPAPAPAPPKPVNAWGSRPMIVPDQLDLGKLLAEGLDERTRASLKKVTSVPRGLINTGNMCFANSVRLPSLRMAKADLLL